MAPDFKTSYLAPDETPRRAAGPWCSGWAAIGMLAALALAGCRRSKDHEVVVYAALDKEFSQPLFSDFERTTGLTVRAKFDVESTKTVGLANALIAEANRPRADVFWNNEILHTLRLAERGLLEAYVPPKAHLFPTAYRDVDGAWHGFAARARVLAVNTELVAAEERPQGLDDLCDPKWRGRVGIAKPLFGTTATHAACLFAVFGDAKAEDFFRRLKANGVQVLSGNKQVAMAVASGEILCGLTDTDDAVAEQAKAFPLAIVYPDSGPDGIGTLFIPNTLAIVTGCPHPAAARQLVDFLLRPETEALLAAGPSAQIPLAEGTRPDSRVMGPGSVKAMQVDFSVAAAKWDRAAKFLRDEFTGAE